MKTFIEWLESMITAHKLPYGYHIIDDPGHWKTRDSKPIANYSTPVANYPPIWSGRSVKQPNESPRTFRKRVDMEALMRKEPLDATKKHSMLNDPVMVRKLKSLLLPEPTPLGKTIKGIPYKDIEKRILNADDYYNGSTKLATTAQYRDLFVSQFGEDPQSEPGRQIARLFARGIDSDVNSKYVDINNVGIAVCRAIKLRYNGFFA